MVGFGPEDDHFVAELTYNYGVGEYQLGNDFLVGERSSTNFAEDTSGSVKKETSAMKRDVFMSPSGSHFAIQQSC